VLLVGIAGAASLGLTTVLSAMWSDRIGRRAVLLIGNGLSLVVSLALFPIIEGGTVLAFLVGVVVLQAAVGVTYGPLGAYLPELFAPRYRYTGAGLSYNLATVLGGALTPLIASELIARFGTFTVGLYLAGLCAVTVVAILLSRETRSTGRTADPVDESGRDEVPLPFDAVPEAPANAR
jgi:MFS family permease